MLENATSIWEKMINLNNYIERIIGTYLLYRFATEAMDRLHDDDCGLPEYIKLESSFISILSKNLSSIPGVVKRRYLKADIQKLSEYWPTGSMQKIQNMSPIFQLSEMVKYLT